MGRQLRLPICGAPLPEPVQRAADALREAPPEVTVRDDFERLLAELEGLYLHLQRTIPYGPEWKKAWHAARDDTCESYGWETEAFYAELKRRRST